MKKKKTTGKYDRVVIKWIDSTARRQVWWNIADIMDDIADGEKTEWMYSTGYLFKDTVKNYYLATSIHFEDSRPVAFGTIFAIPKGCVLSIKKL